MAGAFTPRAGLTYLVVTGAVPVIVIPPNVTGGYIINPLLAADQGLGSAEDLVIDPVNTPTLVANNTSQSLAPGGRFNVIPFSTLPVQANAASSGHKFTAVFWL